MDVQIYCYYDKESKVYDTPFFTANEINAKRNMFNLIKEGAGAFKNFYKDIDLIFLGTFDTQTGVINQKDLRSVINGSTIYKQAFREVKHENAV